MFKSCMGLLKFQNVLVKKGCKLNLCISSLCSENIFNNKAIYDEKHKHSRVGIAYNIMNRTQNQINLVGTQSHIHILIQTRNYNHYSQTKRRRNALKRLKNKQHYDRLGVKPTASMKEIKSAYYELSKQYHPDVNASKEATATYSRISAAYDSLKDPENRIEEEEEEAEETLMKARATQQKRRGKPSSRKDVKFSAEYTEHIDPRWPLEEEWEYSTRHKTIFRKDKNKAATSTSRRIKIHQVDRRDRYFVHHPSSAAKAQTYKADRDASVESEMMGMRMVFLAGLMLTMLVVMSDM